MSEYCYNRGCGQKFDPDNNKEDTCRHHPGQPYFHDAYKIWTCCNKKSVDFTEFLNIKGCTLSKHSNVKPPEPVQKKVDVEILNEAAKTVESKVKEIRLERPPFETTVTLIEPKIAPAFKQQMDSLAPASVKNIDSNEIQPGTMCKNGGCNSAYESPATNDTVCTYHPGSPIFHEGMKYWSCCNRKTSDFTAFVNQIGCENGKHKWIKEEENKSVNCRFDWHQTATNVVVAIYAKLYDYNKSYVKLNPVRLHVKLIFPQQENAEFDLDLELRGIIDVTKSTVNMYGTKVEITMPKAEGGSWAKLDFPRPVKEVVVEKPKETATEKKDDVDDIDLDDVEPISAGGCLITEQLDID